MHSTQCFFKHELELLYIHRHTVLCTKIKYIYHLSIYIQINTLLHRYLYTGWKKKVYQKEVSPWGRLLVELSKSSKGVMEGLCFILFELMEGDSRSFHGRGHQKPAHQLTNTSQIQRVVKTLFHLDVCSFQNDICQKIERYPYISLYFDTQKNMWKDVSMETCWT